MPVVPEPGAVERSNGPEGVAFLQNYDLRFVEGRPPGDGIPRASSATTLWVRHAPGRVLDFSALAALSDIFYPGCTCVAASRCLRAPSR